MELVDSCRKCNSCLLEWCGASDQDMTVWTMKGGFQCTKPVVKCCECAATRVATSDDIRAGLRYEPLTPERPNVVLASDLIDVM